jgi:XTP/dITP diphosphohydrolase
MVKLLLATNNRGKLREYQRLFQDLPYELVTLADQGISFEVDEAGGSLEENARLKALAVATESKLLSLADDSGLEVDALGGEPGPLSHRYAGKGASDADRVDYLLSRLRDIPWPERTARFRCVIALALPGGNIEFCHGECPGIIALEPCGEQGFGYDPIFYMSELDKTMAELSMEEKNQVSHRGKAALEACRVLDRLRGSLTG